MALKRVKLPDNTVQDIHDARIAQIDSELSGTSANPVQNNAISAEFALVTYIGDVEDVVDQIPDEPESEPVIVIGGGDENVIEAITFNGSTVPINSSTKTAAITANIPDAVTESTVSGWGFTKNAGTITGITMNGSSKGTSGTVNLGTVVTSETDPVFTASVAHGITSSDISNWNSKTSNIGTVTQVKVGSTAYDPSSGVVSLPAYPTTLPASDVSAWAKAASKPTYTASEVGALPLSGGTMDSVAEIYLPGSSSLGESKLMRSGLSVSPTANSFSAVTTYRHGSILYSSDGLSLHTISFPNSDGTFALTSDLTSKANLSGAAFTGAVTGTSSGNTAQFRNITISSSEPTSSQGSNGDIWIVI